MHDNHGDGEAECGCGGMCKWSHATKEEKIAMLEKKEERLKHMLAHIQKVKEAVTSGKEMKPEGDKE
jgi:hypothetical protein